MANLNQYVNMQELPEPEERDFELIPDCRLKMQVIKEEVATSDEHQGVRWNIEQEILEEGKYKGRKIWQGISLTNKDGTENVIGRTALRNYWEAMSLPLTQQDSSKACFRPFLGTIRTEKGTGGYKDKNKVTYAASLDAAPKASSVKTDPPFGASEEAATAPKAQPWKKKA